MLSNIAYCQDSIMPDTLLLDSRTEGLDSAESNFVGYAFISFHFIQINVR